MSQNLMVTVNNVELNIWRISGQKRANTEGGDVVVFAEKNMRIDACFLEFFLKNGLFHFKIV